MSYYYCYIIIVLFLYKVNCQFEDYGDIINNGLGDINDDFIIHSFINDGKHSKGGGEEADYLHGDIDYNKIHKSNSLLRTRKFHNYLLSKSSSSLDSSFTTIKCHNYKDFYYLLYKICIESVLCREMYYIDNNTYTTKDSGNSGTITSIKITTNNFKKFVYQLSLTQLFIIYDYNHIINNESSSSSSNDELNFKKQDRLFLFEDNWPIEWIPRYIIQLKNSTNDTTVLLPPQCHQSINIHATENIHFIHITLYLLQSFKTYVINEYHCDDFNERLILDEHNKPHCECKHGKSCNNETNYQTVILALTITLIILIIVWIISMFISTSRLLKKMDQHNTGNNGVNNQKTKII